jgi:hypothetical protein
MKPQGGRQGCVCVSHPLTFRAHIHSTGVWRLAYVGCDVPRYADSINHPSSVVSGFQLQRNRKRIGSMYKPAVMNEGSRSTDSNRIPIASGWTLGARGCRAGAGAGAGHAGWRGF